MFRQRQPKNRSPMKSFFRYLKKVFLETEFPVWLTLLSAVIGAAVTYFLVPTWNETFEKSRAKSEFLISTLSSFHDDSGQLVLQVQAYLRALRANDLIGANKSRTEIQKEITRLNWNAYEFDIVLAADKGGMAVEAYLEQLNLLRFAVARNPSEADIELIECRMGNFVFASYFLLREIGKEANLNFDIDHERLVPAQKSCSDAGEDNIREGATKVQE